MPSNSILLESHFPVEKVSEACIREKSVRPGHLSTLQQWWARRPLAACRAALFAALCCSSEEIEASGELSYLLQVAAPNVQGIENQLVELTARLATWEAKDDELLLQVAQKLIMAGRQSRPLVVDTFAGGGSFPVEALRLGLDAFASDLSPVATTALHVAIEYLPGSGARITDKYKALAKLVERRIDAATRNLYLQSDDQTCLAFFWCLTFTCPACGCQSPLLRDHWLAKGSRNIAVRPLPMTGVGRIQFEAYSPELAAEKAEASRGTISQRGAICSNCRHEITTVWLREEGKKGRIGDQLYAKLLSGKDGRRTYIGATVDDETAAQQAALRPLERRKYSDLPSAPFDKNGIRHTWMIPYGIENIRDLYNHRQSVAFLEILAELEEVRDHLLTDGTAQPDAVPLITLLSLTWNRLISYGTKHCWWQSNGEFPASMFTRQAIPMVWNYAEIPVNSPGAAGWRSAATWMQKVIEHLAMLPHGGKVWQGDAADCQPLRDGVADLVAIDPPYYDSIGYSYLSDVHYVPMKAYLGELYPTEFSCPLSPKREEAIVDRTHQLAPSPKSRAHFQKKLTQALQEVRRVLKPDGHLILMYGHKKLEAWDALLTALVANGFRPTASWPINTERKVKFRHGRIDALSSSCLIVCIPELSTQRKQTLSWKDFEVELRTALKVSIRQFHTLKLLGSDLVASLVAPASGLLLSYDVENGTERLTVKWLLERLPDLAGECELEVLLDELANYPDIVAIVTELSSQSRQSNSKTSVQERRLGSWLATASRHPLLKAASDHALLLYEGRTSEADRMWRELSADDQQAIRLFLRAASLLSSEESFERQVANASASRISHHA